MKNRYIKFLFALPLLMVIFSSCTKMEDNFEEYLGRDPYAPKVNNLSVQNHFKAVTLNWDLPSSTRLEKIEISYDEVVLESELVNSYYIDNLLIKGYTFQVVTIDINGFRSIPVTVYAFPSGEE